MKDIREERLTVAEANEVLGVAMEPDFWEALVRLIDYPELAYDEKAETILFPSYVPFKQLATEWIEGIEAGIYDVRRCEACDRYLDVNRTEGIFGRPDDLEEFICMPCAEQMTAREYFERFVERR
ncbi:MAG: hypothetical protein ACYTDY_19225 [Planctomycetota bacterium]|jgi:hypothetical protein